MVKLKEQRTYGVIEPDLYYVWTFKPRKNPNARQYITERSLYKKHYLRIPFFTRFHAKRTLTIALGNKVLSYIHIVRGKSLIKKGITYLGRDSNWNRIFLGNKKSPKLKQFIIPPEYIYDRHRRRYYRVRLYRAKRLGKENFDNFYAMSLYGYRPGFTKNYTRFKRYKAIGAVLQELRENGEV